MAVPAEGSGPDLAERDVAERDVAKPDAANREALRVRAEIARLTLQLRFVTEQIAAAERALAGCDPERSRRQIRARLERLADRRQMVLDEELLAAQERAEAAVAAARSELGGTGRSTQLADPLPIETFQADLEHVDSLGDVVAWADEVASSVVDVPHPAVPDGVDRDSTQSGSDSDAVSADPPLTDGHDVAEMIAAEITADETISDEIVADEIIADEIIADEIIADEIISDEIIADASHAEPAEILGQAETNEATALVPNAAEPSLAEFSADVMSEAMQMAGGSLDARRPAVQAAGGETALAMGETMDPTVEPPDATGSGDPTGVEAIVDGPMSADASSLTELPDDAFEDGPIEPETRIALSIADSHDALPPTPKFTVRGAPHRPGGDPIVVTIDAEAFAKVFATVFAAVVDERLAAGASPLSIQPAQTQPVYPQYVNPAAPAPKQSFWSNFWHADVVLSVLAMSIVLIVLIAWSS